MFGSKVRFQGVVTVALLALHLVGSTTPEPSTIEKFIVCRHPSEQGETKGGPVNSTWHCSLWMKGLETKTFLKQPVVYDKSVDALFPRMMGLFSMNDVHSSKQLILCAVNVADVLDLNTQAPKDASCTSPLPRDKLVNYMETKYKRDVQDEEEMLLKKSQMDDSGDKAENEKLQRLQGLTTTTGMLTCHPECAHEAAPITPGEQATEDQLKILEAERAAAERAKADPCHPTAPPHPRCVKEGHATPTEDLTSPPPFDATTPEPPALEPDGDVMAAATGAVTAPATGELGSNPQATAPNPQATASNPQATASNPQATEPAHVLAPVNPNPHPTATRVVVPPVSPSPTAESVSGAAVNPSPVDPGAVVNPTPETPAVGVGDVTAAATPLALTPQPLTGTGTVLQKTTNTTDGVAVIKEVPVDLPANAAAPGTPAAAEAEAAVEKAEAAGESPEEVAQAAITAAEKAVAAPDATSLRGSAVAAADNSTTPLASDSVDFEMGVAVTVCRSGAVTGAEKHYVVLQEMACTPWISTQEATEILAPNEPKVSKFVDVRTVGHIRDLVTALRVNDPKSLENSKVTVAPVVSYSICYLNQKFVKDTPYVDKTTPLDVLVSANCSKSLALAEARTFVGSKETENPPTPNHSENGAFVSVG